jgi:hypothetical protein
MALSTLLLAIWLILTGIMAFVKLNFPSRDKVMGAIAILAGIFILIGR